MRPRLEMRCEEPGLWVVEGYQVFRQRQRVQQPNRRGSRWENRWRVTLPSAPGVVLEHFKTFEQALDFIADAG